MLKWSYHLTYTLCVTRAGGGVEDFYEQLRCGEDDWCRLRDRRVIKFR